MALRGMSGVPARVVQVLTDFLPAELDLIDGEESDGITTPDVGFWYEWDIKAIAQFVACSVVAVSSTPTMIHMAGMGSRSDAMHRIDVKFHATIAQEGAPSTPFQLARLMYRYITGAIRVLCIMHPTLDTTADPTIWAVTTIWAGEATYGPEEEQDGQIIRTATLPISVRRIEER